MKKHWKFTVVLLSCVAAIVFALGLCVGCAVDDPTPTNGTVKGVTLDVNGDPLEGVEVYYGEDDPVESGENGSFEIKDIPVGEVNLTAILNGYAEGQKSLAAKDFSNGVANVKIVMEEGKGSITGVVRMDGHPEIKIAGAKVSIGSQYTAITNDKGEYELKDVPMLGTKSVSVSCSGYESTTKRVTTNNYTNGVAKFNFDLVEEDLEELPGLKPYTLKQTPIDPEITVIRSGDIGYYFDVSPDGLQGSSKVETHSEGFCINANSKEDRDTLVAFIAGRITVDPNHKYVTVFAREFNGQNNENDGGPFYAKLGMYLFDVDNTFVTNNNFTQITKESYVPVTFDLTQYEGQTITIVIGTKGGYHCCIDRIEFASNPPVVTEVPGLEQITPSAPNTNDTFDAEALKADWTVGGAAEKIDNGVWLNCKDPWKAHHLDTQNPQPVNSYMYVTKEITAANSTLEYTATIDKIVDCYDTASGNEGFYFPYLQVLVIGADGKTLYSSGWESYWTEIHNSDAEKANYDKGGLTISTAVTDANKTHTFSFDLSDAIGKGNVTVVIACNVGYKATITNANFTTASADNQE